MNLRCLPIALLAAAALLTGCGADSVSTAPIAGPALQGHVVGGQQPVTGSAIALYAVGATGLGSAATSLLTLPVTTIANGAFSITGDYICPSASTQVYIVARGGNPGLTAGTSNAALLMMAPLGRCGSLSPSTFITINEVTTAASAYALAQFAPAGAASGGSFGATATNATGITNAFLVANNLVNVATGFAGGSALPTGATLESAKLYTLADILAVCVNSTGGAACSPLFTAATQGFTPTNTLDAALNIARNPGLNVAAVYNAANPQGPFQPTLTAVPNDWTMSISYIGGGLFGPTALGIDSTGSIWAANYYGGEASKLSAAGIPAAANGFADPHLYESYGLAIDSADSAWITVEESSGVNSGFGSITKFSSTGTLLSGSGFYAGGVYYPYAIAADTNGTMWIADNGDSNATALNNDGTSASGATGYKPTGLSFPTSVALDGAHNAWFGVMGSSVKIAPAGGATVYACCHSPAGVSIDAASNVWIADYMGSSLDQLTPAGVLNQQLVTGGAHNPESVITDAAGNAWMTNYRGNTFSGFTAPATGVSAAISPATGFGVDTNLSQPFGIAVDAAGNLWVSNFALNSLTQFVGLAAPTKTPRLGLAAKP